MKSLKSKLALSLVALIAIGSLGACGGEEEEADAGTVKTDGGGLPPPPDAGNTTTDGGTTTTDGGTTKPSTTVVKINKKEAPAGFVNFKAVAMAPLMYISKSTSDANPANHSCLYGLFVADETAAAENNGVLVISKTTVTDDKCNTDSQLHGVATGDELQINGFYQERCTYWDTATASCKDKDADGNDISIPQVSVNKPGDVTKTGRTGVVPANLPAVVTIDEINSTGSAAPYTLGSKWWTYRTVLVKVENVEAVDVTPSYCEWSVAPQGQTTPTLRVDDAVNFGGTACPHRPAAGAEFDSLAGHLYFGFSFSKILPRTEADASPALPSGN
jgi:hypothetical protein